MTEVEIQVMREFCAQNRILFAPTHETVRAWPVYCYQVEGEAGEIGHYETHEHHLGRLLVLPGRTYGDGDRCRSCWRYERWYVSLIVRSQAPSSHYLAACGLDAEAWNCFPLQVQGRICWDCQLPARISSDNRHLAKVCGTYRSPRHLFESLLKAFPPPIPRLPEARVVRI